MGFLAFGFAFLFIVLGILLIPFIFYLITLQNTLKAIAPQNRKMDPAMVWLMFIPVFNIVWQFILVVRIADSIQAELAMRQSPTPDKPTLGIGLAHCILRFFWFFPFAIIAWLICFIIHWVKVYDYKKMFESPFFHRSGNDSIIFDKL